MRKSFDNIPEKTKLVIKSVLPFFIVLILFVIVGRFGIGKVIELQGQIDKAEKDKTILTQKLTLLESIAQTVSQDSGSAVAALPDKNPSLIVISQLKNLGAVNGLVLLGTKSAAPVEDKGGISHITISFGVTGDRGQIISFLKTIATVAPITLLDKIRISESTGITRADVSVKAYWGELPKTLPTLTTPITDLTPAEKTILQSVTNLIQPQFVEIPASSDGGKVDPFQTQ